MIDENELPEDSEEDEFEECEDDDECQVDECGFIPRTLSGFSSEVYLHPDAATFCDQHEIAALLAIEGALLCIPRGEHKWVDIGDYLARRAKAASRSNSRITQIK